MRPFLQRLAKVAECFVHVYSNAGLPNAMGGYDDTPEDMARDNLLFAEEGLINMLGGCCGSTPPHIKARKEGLDGGKRVFVVYQNVVSSWVSFFFLVFLFLCFLVFSRRS